MTAETPSVTGVEEPDLDDMAMMPLEIVPREGVEVIPPIGSFYRHRGAQTEEEIANLTQAIEELIVIVHGKAALKKAPPATRRRSSTR